MGESLWHETTEATSNIYTRGKVFLALDKLEFAGSGLGNYIETVNLIGLLKRYTAPCTDALNVSGEITYEDWGWVQKKITRSIKWTRLTDGRLELQKIGLNSMTDYSVTVAAALNGQLLRVNYNANNSPTLAEPKTIFRNTTCRGLTHMDPPIPQGIRRGVLDESGPLIEWALARR